MQSVTVFADHVCPDRKDSLPLLHQVFSEIQVHGVWLCCSVTTVVGAILSWDVATIALFTTNGGTVASDLFKLILLPKCGCSPDLQVQAYSFDG